VNRVRRAYSGIAGAGAAPIDDQPEQHRQFVLIVLEQLVLQRGFEIGEARHGRTARLTNLRPVLADRNAQILGDAFR
jgi:hypothetical protein